MNIIFIISTIENLRKCILYSYIVIDLIFFALDTLTHICYVYATVDVDIVTYTLFSFKVLLVSFVSERGLKGFQEFSDEVWLCRFCFLTDISPHLNEQCLVALTRASSCSPR